MAQPSETRVGTRVQLQIDPGPHRFGWKTFVCERGTACPYQVVDLLTEEVLYVGCTNDPVRRMLQHDRSGRYRLEEVRYVVGDRLPARRAADRETALIRQFHPRDNVNGGGGYYARRYREFVGNNGSSH